MNTWVRRSLEASIVAAGFVVIGAGVANAAEPAHSAGLPNADQVTHTATGLVGTVTKTAHDLTGGAGLGAHKATAPTHVAKQRPVTSAHTGHTLPAHTLPGHHTGVHSVTGLVHRTTAGLLGDEQAHPMRHRAAAHEGLTKGVHVAKTVGVSRAVDVAPLAGNITSTATGVGDGRLDLRNLTRPAGSLDLTGTGETIGTATANVGHVGAVYGMTDTFGAVDAVGRLTGNLKKGRVDAVGSLDALLSSSNELGGNFGRLGSLDGTLDVNAVGDALVVATGRLAHGDLSGVAAATGAADVATTLNGALGDHAKLASSADLSAVLDASLVAAGELCRGHVWALGQLFGQLDGSLHVVGYVHGVGRLYVTGTLSAVLEGTLKAVGNLRSHHLTVVPSAHGSLDDAVAHAVASLGHGWPFAVVTGDLSGRSISL